MNQPDNEILNFIGPIFNDLTDEQKERLDRCQGRLRILRI